MMDARAVFGLSALLGLVASFLVAFVYVWPRLRDLPTRRALALLVIPHLFRFVGLSFLVVGVVGPQLPRGFAGPAVVGDLITCVLAIAATFALAKRRAWALSIVVLMNAWGTADLVVVGIRGAALGLDPGQLGAAFFIPTVGAPILLATHALSFRVLGAVVTERRHHGGRAADICVR